MNNIKHLVISGGGPLFLYSFGVLRELKKRNIINFNEIKSIYGTSSGSIVSLLVSCGVNFDDIAQYLIDYPYEKNFTMSFDKLMNLSKNQGLININTVDHFIDPLLKTANMNTNINLKDYYETTNIDLHIYSTEVNEFKTVDLNYRDYPYVRLKDAIYASCAIPVLFEPCYLDISNLTPINKEGIQDNHKKTVNSNVQECFIDGGIFCNIPLGACMEREYGYTFDKLYNIENYTANEDYKNEILCVRYERNTHNSVIHKKDNLVTFINSLTQKIIKHMETHETYNLLNYINNDIIIDLKNNETNWFNIIRSRESRNDILNKHSIDICSEILNV
jgi:predicted patatin/cPLA2 family phospholipase